MSEEKTTSFGILTRILCPYCGERVWLYKNSSFIFSKDYGPHYVCIACDARVGCHPGTKIPLGTLANKELRDMRAEAHFFFDALWLEEAERTGLSKRTARTNWYTILSSILEVPIDDCHMGFFDTTQCNQVIIWAKPRYLALPEKFRRKYRLNVKTKGVSHDSKST